MESVYEVCLCKELQIRNLKYSRQVPVPVNYKGELLNAEYRIDVIVENEIIVELKAVENIITCS